MQNQAEADIVYEEEQNVGFGSGSFDGDRYNNNNMHGYKADFEGYGDETDFNIETDNQLNFMSSRIGGGTYQPVRNKGHVIHRR